MGGGRRKRCCRQARERAVRRRRGLLGLWGRDPETLRHWHRWLRHWHRRHRWHRRRHQHRRHRCHRRGSGEEVAGAMGRRSAMLDQSARHRPLRPIRRVDHRLGHGRVGWRGGEPVLGNALPQVEIDHGGRVGVRRVRRGRIHNELLALVGERLALVGERQPRVVVCRHLVMVGCHLHMMLGHNLLRCESARGEEAILLRSGRVGVELGRPVLGRLPRRQRWRPDGCVLQGGSQQPRGLRAGWWNPRPVWLPHETGRMGGWRTVVRLEGQGTQSARRQRAGRKRPRRGGSLAGSQRRHASNELCWHAGD